MTACRAPLEVFTAHGAALLSGDVEAIAADYAEDCVIMLPGRQIHGRGQAGVRGFFAGPLAALPEPRWTAVSTAASGETVFHERSVTSALHRVDDGIDTLLVRDGLIQVQTVRYTLTARADPTSAARPAASEEDAMEPVIDLSS